MSVNADVSPACELRELDMKLINEPELPVREAMDEKKLQDLAESIRAVGVIQPIRVFPVRKRFEIIAGHRRFKASQIAGRRTIPSLVYTSKEVAFEAVKLHENLHREELTAAEEALFFAELVDKHHYNEAELCSAVHKSADYIGDRLRLLQGDRAIFDALRARQIKFGVARELNKITDPHYRQFYLKAAIDSDPRYNVVQQWVAEWRTMTAPSARPAIEETPAPDGTAPVVHVDACEVCGGTLDPWNLVFVRIHKWEWENIQRELSKIGKGE